MYKLLLCWRYLRTRWIALASVVSVTLGVATMIVVNSVMDGFTTEMHARIHGILSDIVLQSYASQGIQNPEVIQEEVKRQLGDRVQGMTTVVTVPAMITYSVRGQSHTQQINLIGIDTNTYASVSDFSQYLMHPSNQKQLDFLLRDTGYGPGRPALEDSGWEYRRIKAREQKREQAARKQLEEEYARNRALRAQIAAVSSSSGQPEPGEPQPVAGDSELPPVPTPDGFQPNLSLANTQSPISSDGSVGQGPMMFPPTADQVGRNEFDAEKETHFGIILGIGIGSRRYRNEEGVVEDIHFIKPGDDVSVTFPGASIPPRAVDTRCTVVDLYESKMSEYDSTFCFVPMSELQRLRGMIDPESGSRAVTSIQIKLVPGAKLDECRDALRDAFPPMTGLHVESWRDSQGPLLAAVQMETTILNILLFMIIAVAGFGILATFFMIVVEKTKDIGVMKSLGAPGTGIASIFLGYGLLLGSVGAGAGAILGLLFVWNINRIAKVIEWISGREVFDPTVYYFTTIPTIIHPFMIVWVVLGAVLIAVLASVLPSIRAARMRPVEALRYE